MLVTAKNERKVRWISVFTILLLAVISVGCVGGATEATGRGGNGTPSELPGQPVCGNLNCESSETKENCCPDCGCDTGLHCDKQTNSCKPECGDGVCTATESKESCCKDCGCEAGLHCDEQLNTCKPSCGDGVCAGGENQDTCCQDCGCSSGMTCQNNICIELKPNIQFTDFVQTTPADSVTYLRAKGDNIALIPLYNGGNDVAQNVKLVITSPNQYFGEKTIDVGTLAPGASYQTVISLNFFDKVLDIVTDTPLQLDIKAEYYNSVNKKYETKDSKEITVKGRNAFSWEHPEMIASWVTPSQPTIKEFASKSTGGLATYSSTTEQMLAARWIFETMRAYGVKYVTDPTKGLDYIQFPIETLKNKGGDCEDNAILYASLMESIGIDSFVVLVPGHAFAGFVNKENGAVPIETTANDFDSALASGVSEYNSYLQQGKLQLVYPEQNWGTYPEVTLPETTEIAMPSITKEKGNCGISFDFQKGFFATIPIKFVNSGNAPGAGCAAAVTYNSNHQKIGEDLRCWTINPGETKNVNYEPDITMTDWLSGYYCVAV